MQLASLFRASRSIVAFTGAGVSTESGIPDFRSPTGLWTRYDPKIQEFHTYVSDRASRAAYWAMRQAMLRSSPLRPNEAHRALARLERAGRSPGAHHPEHRRAPPGSGVPHGGGAPRHGARGDVHRSRAHRRDSRRLRVASARRLGVRPDGRRRSRPDMPGVRGLVKSSTVSFGQQLFPGVVDRANELIRSADLVVVVGSSLRVYPAASLPMQAFDAGAKLAIVNDEPTPYDDLADVVVRGRAGAVLPGAVEAALGA